MMSDKLSTITRMLPVGYEVSMCRKTLAAHYPDYFYAQITNKDNPLFFIDTSGKFHRSPEEAIADAFDHFSLYVVGLIERANNAALVGLANSKEK